MDNRLDYGLDCPDDTSIVHSVRSFRRPSASCPTPTAERTGLGQTRYSPSLPYGSYSGRPRALAYMHRRTIGYSLDYAIALVERDIHVP